LHRRGFPIFFIEAALKRFPREGALFALRVAVELWDMVLYEHNSRRGMRWPMLRCR
jgi:hypothetical protein